MGERTKFELRLNDSDRWFVEKIFKDKSLAERAFQEFVDDDNSAYAGVQIVRVWTRSDDMEVEKILKEERLKQKSAPVKLANIDEAAPCAHRGDYLGLSARITMSRLLRNYLDREGLIPSELIYNYDRAKRFMAGNLSGPAIDRISVLQARGTGLDSRKRRDDIYVEIQNIMDDVQKIQKSKLFKACDTKDLNELVKVGKSIGKPMAFHAVLCKTLLNYRSPEGKMAQLLDWLNTDIGKEVEHELDSLLAEILSSAVLIQDMLGPQRNLGEAISTLLDWEAGKPMEGTGASPEAVTKICHLFSQNRLNATRDVLFDFILRQLGGKQPLARNDPSMEEKEFLKVFVRVTQPSGMTGGSNMAEALTRRYGRSLTQGGESGERMSIKWLLDMLPNGATRLSYLLALQDAPLGESHPDIIKQSLMAMCNTARSIADFVESKISAKARLISMRDLHVQVEESSLSEADQKSVLSTLDMIVEKYLLDTGLIDKLDDPNAKLRDRAIRMVQFCGSGVLWKRGHAMALAQSRVIEHLKGKSFIEKFTEDEADPAKKEKMIRDFYKMMADAGFKS